MKTNAPSKSQLIELSQDEIGKVPIQSWAGREFKTANRSFVDFASTNYLGFDFDPLMHKRGTEYAQKWGSIAGWSRLEVDPEIYRSLESRLCGFLGVENILLSHTITITNFSTIPVVAEKGIIFADSVVHTVVWEACRLARDHGAKLVKFQHQNLQNLEDLLKQNKDVHPKIIAVDGVYSISTEIAPVRELLDLCRRYDAYLYIDDAHGFGVLGEDPTQKNPLGLKGNGVVNFASANWDRIFYVSSFGKAFCTYTAFSTIPPEFKSDLSALSMQNIFSAPPLPYVLGTVEAALDLNEQRGDQARAKILALTKRLVDGLRSLGCNVTNEIYQPVVFLEVGTVDQLRDFARLLWDAGFVAGVRAFPLVPPDECGLRFATSALHDEKHIDSLLNAVEKIRSQLNSKAA